MAKKKEEVKKEDIASNANTKEHKNQDIAKVEKKNTDAPKNSVKKEKSRQSEESSKKTLKTKKDSRHEMRVGDTVVINYKIIEGEKLRVQPYEGIVIAIKGSGISKTFTVRRISAANVGVERIFPLESPNIDSIQIKSKGKIRRSKLYYLRDRVGRAAIKVKTL